MVCVCAWVWVWVWVCVWREKGGEGVCGVWCGGGGGSSDGAISDVSYHCVRAIDSGGRSPGSHQTPGDPATPSSR